MLNETRPAPPVERELQLDGGTEPSDPAVIDFPELAAVGAALAALLLTVGLVRALLFGQPGLDAADAAIVASVWLLAVTCWRSRTPTAP